MLVYVFSFLALALAALVISYPLFFHRLESYLLAEPPREAFEERDAVLESLSDLEVSFHSGKLSQGDYEAQKAALERRYIDLVEAREQASRA
jgi:hypothetical protein